MTKTNDSSRVEILYSSKGFGRVSGEHELNCFGLDIQCIEGVHSLHIAYFGRFLWTEGSYGWHSLEPGDALLEHFQRATNLFPFVHG